MCVCVCIVNQYEMISIESGVKPPVGWKQEAHARRLCLWNAMTSVPRSHLGDQWDS